MPDGDKAHKRLHGYYQKPYKLLCGTNFSAEEVGQALLEAVARDLHNYPVPLSLLDAGAREMPYGMPVSLVDRRSVSGALNMLVQISSHKKTIKTITLAALRICLNELQFDRISQVSSVQVVGTYLTRFYSARFAEVVPTNSQHYNNASNRLVTERLAQLVPTVERGLAKMAQQTVRKEDCSPRAPRSNFASAPITAETDLSVL